MTNLIFKRILNRKYVSLIMIIAFIFIYILIPLGLKYSQESKLIVDHTIEKYGRGSYDLLVRPAQSRTETEKTLGLIEENYIGDGKGGISIKEWKELEKNQRVEVAAPVASIGYFSGKRPSITLPLLDDSTKFTWSFSTMDGINDYTLTGSKELLYFHESQPGLIQYIKRLDVNLGEVTAGANSMDVMLPSTYHLLAAVDIESEQKLTGVNFKDLYNDVDPSNLEAINNTFGNVPIIKVIQRKDINIPIKMKLRTEKVDVNLLDYQKKLGLTDEDWLLSADQTKIDSALKEVSKDKIIKSNTYEIDLSEYQKPFDGTVLQINKDFKIEKATSFMQDRANTPVFFTADKIKYKQKNNNTLQVKVTKEGSPPEYKQLEQYGENLYLSGEVPYLLEQVGSYSLEDMDENTLVSSPLGIYGTSEVKTTDGVIVKATANPGSFISQPAGALISMESATLIKGSKPIDAIRIRVAGIDGYDKKAQIRVQEVAEELLKKGYEVDVVAGSSFQNMSMEVEGIGNVTQKWTTLGVAQKLTESWNIVTIITTSLFLLFSFIWVLARISLEKNILDKENKLLQEIGWSKKNIKLRNFMELCLLMSIAFVIALIVLLISNVGFKYILLLSGIWIFSILFGGLLLSLKTNVNKRTYARKIWPAFFYYFHLIFPTMLVLIVSYILITVQFSVLGNTLEENRLTDMGMYSLDLTFWLNLIVLIVTLVLSTYSIIECFLSLFTVRKEEYNMYYTIGWNKKQIVNLYIKEVMSWSLLAVIIGVVLCIFTLLLLEISIKWLIIGLIISFILLLSIIFLLSLTISRQKLKII